MSNKLFVVFAAVCAALLATQTASCEDVEVQQPDELLIMNPDSDFPVIVTDPGLLDRQQDARKCNPDQCTTQCRQSGYRIGTCNKKGVCKCSEKIKTFIKCVANQCSNKCRQLGFATGYCNIGGCVCA